MAMSRAAISDELVGYPSAETRAAEEGQAHAEEKVPLIVLLDVVGHEFTDHAV
jgi:hypothetical protein